MGLIEADSRRKDETVFPENIPRLTSLRFFAALWVVAHHLSEQTVVGANILTQGSLAVDFFFLLSGFILTHAHLLEIKQNALGYFHFIVKRLARIYPLHLAVTLFLVVMVAALHFKRIPLPNPERYNGVQLVLNLLLLHGWQARDASGWNYPSWSVSAEWFAYLIFPFIAPFVLNTLRRINSLVIVAVAVGVVIGVWSMSPILLHVGFFDLHSNFGVVRILPEFCLGIACYRLGSERRLPGVTSAFATPVLIVAIVLAKYLRLELLIFGLFAFLILAAASADAETRPGILRTTPLVYLGRLSYALFLVHVPVITVFFKVATLAFGHVPVWMFPLTAVGALAAAVVAHHLVEVPCHDLIVRFLAREPNRRTTESSAVVDRSAPGIL